MIYAVSLVIAARKAYKGRVVGSSMPKIIEQLALDPQVSSMDCVLISPQDVKGPSGVEFNKHLETKHPGVCIIYFYNRDSEANLVNTENKVQAKHIKDTVIKDAVSKYLGDNIIKTGRSKVTSLDFEDPGLDGEKIVGRKNVRKKKARDEDDINTNIDDLGYSDSLDQHGNVRRNYTDIKYLDDDNNVIQGGYQRYEEEELEEIEDLEELEEVEDLEEASDATDSATNDIPIDLPEDPDMSQQLTVRNNIDDPLHADNVPIPNGMSSMKIEDQLSKVNNVQEWELFKENLRMDSVVEHLVSENADYVGLINMLSVLDKKIEAVWRDPALTPDQKFDKITELGLQKSIRRESVNSQNVDKAISIITTITLAAKRTVEERIASIDMAALKITTDKEAVLDTSKIDEAISKRADIQLELLSLSRSIVDLYKSMNLLVTDTIRSLDADLPSSSEFINNMVAPVGVDIFTPTNTSELANKILQSLQENRLTASQMEAKVNNLIDLLFEFCAQDEAIIKYQQNMINMLKAQHVEDIIIIDSLLKNCLRLYTGPTEAGVHATAITWSGVLSRRQNTLLIDLSGRPKFDEYGIKAVDLNDFMTDRIEKQFLCVESAHKLNTVELQKFVVELKSRLNYYTIINIIVDGSDADTLDQLSADALTVHYITNCTPKSLKDISETVSIPIVKNVARKLILIDAPVNPLMIAEKIGVNPTVTQLIMLPNLPDMRMCSINHERPYEFRDLSAIFERAFGK